MGAPRTSGSTTDYDAVVVGASLGGCTAAVLLARQGARVALLDRVRDPAAYKKACTHFIIASATPVLERLGLVEGLEAAGAVRNGVDLWSRYGWVRPRAAGNGTEPSYGYDIRREKLDPMLRALAAGTEGVDLLLGAHVTDLLRDGAGRPSGVQAQVGGAQRRITARVVVGADGRGSDVARLARVPGRVRPHGRFGYFTYYENLPLVTGTRSQLWMLDPDVVYAFPNDDGLTLTACFVSKARRAEFRDDLEGAFARMFEGLPEGPDLATGRRVGPLIGRIELPNVRRPAGVPGVGFVGDAAQASDPVWGVGCGFALRSGSWLADELGPPLVEGGDVDAALRRYRQRHRRELGAHHFMMSDYANGRPFNPIEKLLYLGGVRDQRVALALERLAHRNAPPQQIFTPGVIARAAWAAGRQARQRTRTPTVV